MNTGQLFKERMQTSWFHAIRMLRAIFSGGGTPLFVGIFLILLYFGYTRFLEWLPRDFPTVSLLAFIFSLFLTSSRVRTWIRQPDLVFLLPMEPGMKDYFRASLIYSSVIHLIHLAVITGFAYPLFRVHLGSSTEFGIVFLLLGLMQVWNVLTGWYEERLSVFRSRAMVRILILLRWIINLGLAALILSKNWTLVIPALLIPAAVLWYIRSITPALPYPWEKLKKREQLTISRYYALAGWFIDVPQVKKEVKQRKILIGIMNRLFPNQKPLSYLYWRSFFRYSELFPIYIRLMGWAVLMVLILPHPWVSLTLLLLSLWMFGVQLPAIAAPGQYPVWIRLYPLSKEEQIRSLIRMGRVLLGFQTVLFTLVLFLLNRIPGLWAMIHGIIGLLAVYLISTFYLPRRLHRWISL
ncbi:ABC transporter permease [Paenactinomyces guangxiensis]|uniref:ABC transporter permease n=1 Tax=Paenactinomyces guangxiensis TaxID=1490290 RepID=A0A7W2AAF2_9BACL|nr:ABC transporter permease [Paenactinomyces guangxiensis]MBA4496144.1 ABC transporter permease [Paenactinomyces guangxiensis]MBH8593232.1 ABC transporter permease [Paenactinomyces guangxiensis]